MIRIIAIVVATGALVMVLYLLFSKKQKHWYEMTEDEQKKKRVLFAGAITVFLAGILTALLTGKKK